MHELSLAKNIVKIVLDSLQEINEPVRVKSVKLKVGKIHVVVPEALSFCFELLAKDTPLEGANLIIEEIPIHARCNKCGHYFEIDNYLFVCPKCGSPDLEVEKGEELIVESFEAVKEESDGNQSSKKNSRDQRENG